jgi:hypothetical protein
MAAGYSGTPLQQKLGYKEGWRVSFAGEVPDAFASQFAGLVVRSRVGPNLDAAHVFVRTNAELGRWAERLLPALGDTGVLWVSWPKKSSGVATDLTENVLRDVLLPTGWVDTKVCAVDDTWSGLKFVKRLSERAR